MWSIEDEERVCECNFCYKKPNIQIVFDVPKYLWYFQIKCQNENCISGIITKLHNIYDENALSECIEEWNKLNKKEEHILKVTGTMTLDVESMKKIKEQVRNEVMKDLEIDGLWVEEAKKFLTNIDTISGFDYIFKDCLEKFLENHKDGEFHFDDEKIYKKLQMCLDILKM